MPVIVAPCFPLSAAFPCLSFTMPKIVISETRMLLQQLILYIHFAYSSCCSKQHSSQTHSIDIDSIVL
jgi:hypothetical protein